MESNSQSKKAVDYWNIVNIGDIVDKINQKDPTKTPDWIFKYVDVSSVSNSNLKIVNFTEYDGKNAPSRAKKIIKLNDIIFATIRPNLKRIALVPKDFDGQVCSTAFCVLRCKTSLADPMYVYQFVSTDKFVKDVSYLQRGSGYPAVLDSDILDQPINLPSLIEQRKIAAILSTVDASIEATERIIEHIKQLKKGIMDQILTKGIAHSEFQTTKVGSIPSLWELKKLKDIANVTVGYVGSTEKYYCNPDEGVLFLRTGNITEVGLDLTDVKYIKRNFHEQIIKSSLILGDVIVSRVGITGIAAVVPNNLGNVNCANMIIIRPINKITSEYLHLLFSSDLILKQVRSFTAGSVQSVFNIGLVEKLKIPLPDVTEQWEIVSIVSSLDSKIKIENEYKNNLIQQKRGLMQVLLTGKVRVKVES